MMTQEIPEAQPRAAGLNTPIDPVELQSRYLVDVLRYVSAFIRPTAEAEDVTMEVFHAAFAALHKLKSKDEPRSWLLGIARRKCADSLRRSYRRRENRLEDASDLLATSSDMDEAADVREALRHLPSDQREALILKYVSGLTIEEVGHVMGRSAAAANSLIQRARDNFCEQAAHLFASSSEATL